jgi:glutamate decarboxylase
MGPFQLISRGDELPVFAFALKEQTNFNVFDLSERLRDRGWLVPAYTFPQDREDLAVLRIVVKEGFSREMADLLLADLQRHLHFFASQPGYQPTSAHSGFSHGVSAGEKPVSKH